MKQERLDEILRTARIAFISYSVSLEKEGKVEDAEEVDQALIDLIYLFKGNKFESDNIKFIAEVLSEEQKERGKQD